MNDSRISIEHAKAVKGLGFDEKTNDWYRETGDGVVFLKTDSQIACRDMDAITEGSGVEYFPAATYGEAFDWLKQAKGISVSISETGTEAMVSVGRRTVCRRRFDADADAWAETLSYVLREVVNTNSIQILEHGSKYCLSSGMEVMNRKLDGWLKPDLVRIGMELDLGEPSTYQDAVDYMASLGCDIAVNLGDDPYVSVAFTGRERRELEDIETADRTFTAEVMQKTVQAAARLIAGMSLAFCYSDTDEKVDGFRISEDGTICKVGDGARLYDGTTYATYKLAWRVKAESTLDFIIRNDARFGGPVTDDEWDDTGTDKYAIRRSGSSGLYVAESANRGDYEFLAFHQQAQAEAFLDEFRPFIMAYFMIDIDKS